MVTIYKSDTFINILYYQISGLVRRSEAIELETHFRKYYSNLSNVITVMYIMDDATLSEKSFLNKLADINTQHKTIINCTYVVGLTGVRKLFYNIYKFLTPSDPVQIILKQTLEDIERCLLVNFKTDFSRT